MTQLELKSKSIESRVEKIEKELLVLKLALKKHKTKKVNLQELVYKIFPKPHQLRPLL